MEQQVKKTINATFQFVRYTKEEWENLTDYILNEGEPGVEIDTGKLKIGNGIDNWIALPYTDATTISGYEASIEDDNGEPSVSVSINNNILHFNFKNLKGDVGPAGQDGVDGLTPDPLPTRNFIIYNDNDDENIQEDLNDPDNPKAYLNKIQYDEDIHLGDILISKFNGNLFKIISNLLSDSYYQVKPLNFSIKGRDGKIGADGKDGAEGPEGRRGKQGVAGPQGIQGIPGQKGEQGDPGVSGVYIGSTAPIDNNVNVWIDTSDITLLKAGGNSF